MKFFRSFLHACPVEQRILGKKYADGFLIVKRPLYTVFVEKFYFFALKKNAREF
jgi:hypothetical protein